MPRRPTKARGKSSRKGRKRLQTLLKTEREFWSRGLGALAGIDEVGRGPLAGPVVAAAVILPVDCAVRGADDSKKLSFGQREELMREILDCALCVRLGAASTQEIDRINILRATALAMRRAVDKLDPVPEHLLVDGLPVPELGLDRQTAVVGGDGLVHSISCASIVAKVYRDRLMVRLAERYPQYGWASNKGYGTADHRAAIFEFGMTPHHRRTFQPMEQFALALDPPAPQ